MNPTRFVKSGDVELAVYVWGARKRNTPIIVLVHGYPDSAEVWQAMAKRLAKRYRVIAYDVRGAGRSTRPAQTQAYLLDRLVEDLAAVVDALSPDQAVHLAGHDWGSIQSWEAVTTSRLEGRIASYTTISGPSLDHIGYRIRQRLKQSPVRGAREMVRQMMHSWYIGMFHLPGLAPAAWSLGLDRLWPKILAEVEGIRGVESSATQRADGRAGIELYRANFAERLLRPRERHTRILVQVIVPLRDRFVTRPLLDDLSQWAPNLWRRDVDAGHWLPLSHAELLASWIGEFVDFVEGAPESTALQHARQFARTRWSREASELPLEPCR